MAISKIPGAGVSADTLEAGDIADDAIGTAELANDVTISTSGNIATTGSGTLSVAGTSTLTGNVTAAGTHAVTGNATVGGTLGVTGNATASGNLTVTGDIVPSTPFSHRNLIINGGMQVWQRATAATTASAYDTVDRWKMNNGSNGAMTSQRHTMSLAELNTTGHNYALQLDVTTVDTSIAAGQYVYFYQRIEAQDLQHLQYGTANAKTITLSFWVKSNKTGTYTVNFRKTDTTQYFCPIEYTISSANTWEQKKITITPTAGSTSLITGAGGIIANDNGDGLQLSFGLTWGSTYHGTSNTWSASPHYSTSNQVNWMDSTSNNFYLTGIQLELGSNATPFEHRSYADELVRCHRYYQLLTKSNGSAAQVIASGYNYSGSEADCQIHLVTPMRANPSLEQDTGSNFCNWHSGSSIGVSGLSGIQHPAPGAYATSAPKGEVAMVNSYLSGLSLTSGNGGMFRQSGASAGSKIALSAEL